MARIDPQIQAHLEWLGFVQPTGLVVSAPALVRAGAILDRRDRDGQRLLQECVEERPTGPSGEPEPVIVDFERFAREVLGWSFSPKGYAGLDGTPIPEELELVAARLRRDPAAGPRRARARAGRRRAALAAARARARPRGRLRQATGRARQARGQRARADGAAAARDRCVPAGLLFNGRALRLISAPRGESSGWLEFNVSDMVQTAGRPICAALRLLLGQDTLLARPRTERLAALLKSSREYQNEVSREARRAGAARAVRAAARLPGRPRRLRRRAAARRRSPSDPDEVYRALLTVILRLVFLLYAEEREMLPRRRDLPALLLARGAVRAAARGRRAATRTRWTSATAPGRSCSRCSAWSTTAHTPASATMPARHGVLFDPDRYPFLEGRPSAGGRQIHERIEPPLVPDGTIYRVLEKLLVLDGERLSYRALDVEQIGSVYETMMGFRLEQATGRSVAIKAQKSFGAPTTVDLEALLGVAADKRAKWLQDHADRKLTPKVASRGQGRRPRSTTCTPRSRR